MRRRVREARNSCQPRILAIINPGNPTGECVCVCVCVCSLFHSLSLSLPPSHLSHPGQCLAEENIRDIVELCREEGLVIIADEVYQENVYDAAIRFTSFRKVVKQMKADDVQLVSIHSISKGYTGEYVLDTPSLTHSLSHPLTPSLPHSLSHSLPPSLTHSLSHPLPPSLTHSLTHHTLSRHTHHTQTRESSMHTSVLSPLLPPQMWC